MTIRAVVQHGQLTPEGPIDLPEGTVVEVQVSEVPQASAPRGSLEALAQLHLRWAGEPDELELLEEQVRRAKQDDLVRFANRYQEPRL